MKKWVEAPNYNTTCLSLCSWGHIHRSQRDAVGTMRVSGWQLHARSPVLVPLVPQGSPKRASRGAVRGHGGSWQHFRPAGATLCPACPQLGRHTCRNHLCWQLLDLSVPITMVAL